MKISKIEALGNAISLIQTDIECSEDNNENLEMWQETQATLFRIRISLLKAKSERKRK